ncbi:olfactory receptor 1G1-like [Aquarana catesbeiana]|uniref:olfactory receptor 1G1-like n=1 Tax=Aquarana catesbeiana TaxID=8400 RepID=UPI003CCA157E
MENITSPIDVHILPFFIKTGNTLIIFGTVYFFFIYLFGMLVNIIIIAVICLDLHLHTPMYLFLWNLSVVDISYTTVTIPKLLYILLSGNNSVSFTQCFIQMYFMLIADSAEAIVLILMAYDRYVAICHPLHYHRILSKKICILLIIAIWIGGNVNSSLMTSSVLRIIFCSSVTIHQFFCDAKALINKSCGGTEMYYIVMYEVYLVFGLCPVMCNLMSYVQIFKVIQNIKSKDSRSKVFSTCSSHLIVLALFYGSSGSVYMTPPSDRYDLLEQILTMFYTTVVPMLNPLVYSLRNKEIRNSLRRLVS